MELNKLEKFLTRRNMFKLSFYLFAMRLEWRKHKQIGIMKQRAEAILQGKHNEMDSI
jgi:hypothetical protein